MNRVLAVVRGEAPVSSLKGSADRAERAQLADLAAGILHYSRRKRGLKGWAQFLVRSDLVELEPAHGSADWDALLAAVWDASAGAPLPASAVAVAARVSAADVIPS